MFNIFTGLSGTGRTWGDQTGGFHSPELVDQYIRSFYPGYMPGSQGGGQQAQPMANGAGWSQPMGGGDPMGNMVQPQMATMSQQQPVQFAQRRGGGFNPRMMQAMAQGLMGNRNYIGGGATGATTPVGHQRAAGGWLRR